ncbi:MAG: PDZ domain-containing protein [Chitinophagales bacterium]|nr:PDZ domain-containing protein [Chitinophagales bacterium]
MKLKFTIVLLFILSTIVSFGKDQGYLGVMVTNYDANNLQGALIKNIFDDGAAKHSDLKENDIIVELNNATINSKDELIATLKKYAWGDKVKIAYIRDGVTYNTSMHLGYKAMTKTYDIQRKIINNQENWFFHDDNTVVVVDDNNAPVSISKQENNCNIDTWLVDEDYHSDELPQCYLDLDDKMHAITRIKEDQARRNVKINNITYIKNIKEKTPIEETNKVDELLLNTFSISPNPSSGLFTLNIQSATTLPITVYMFDITGKIIFEEYLGNYNGSYIKSYDKTDLAKGTYLIQVRQGQQVRSKKIILQ